MNKVFLGIILAVCILGMFLVMLNDRMGRKPEQRPNPPVAEMQPTPATPQEIEANARALEIADAAKALSAKPESPVEDLGKFDNLPLPPPIIETVPQEPLQAPTEKPQQAKEEVRAPAPVPPVQAKTETPPEPPKQEPKKPQTPPKTDAPIQSEAPKGDAAQAKRTVSRFVIYSRDKGATVRIGGDAKMGYSYMTLENPDRVVVDLNGIWKFPANPGVPKNELVSAVRVGQNGDKSRLVIDLKVKPRKVILAPFKNGDGVDVRIDR